jgi:hypothetical protein
MIDGYWTRQDLVGSDRGLIAVSSRNLPELIEENHEKSQPNISGFKAEIWTEYIPNTNL